MVDLMDEAAYVRYILEHGISQKWQRDTALLVKYFAGEGLKRKAIKEKILEMLFNASTRKNNKVNVSRIRDYKQINTIITDSWNQYTNGARLREIKNVEVPENIINSFLSLQNMIIPEDIIIKRNLKGSKKLGFERVKYLWTLYIWVEIQRHYLDRPDIIYLASGQSAKFKQAAGLKTNFSMIKERNLLEDLGLIKVNFGGGIQLCMDKIVGEEKLGDGVLLTNNDLAENPEGYFEGDLYNPGKFLEEWQNGKRPKA